MTRCEACRYNVDARCIQEDLAHTGGWYKHGGTLTRTGAGFAVDVKCQRFAPALPGMEVHDDGLAGVGKDVGR